ncbi:MAG: S-layer homology domain-containing protein, partial [Candidatus Parabeggiatoa sp.]|nr:S-layer homology domain-containing protein [Candidatus Parabeggiatoa sp.]
YFFDKAFVHTILDMHPRSNIKNCPIAVQVNGIRWCDEDQYLTNWNLGSIYNKVDYEPLFIQINRDLNDIACVAKPEICSNVLDTPCQKSISDCHQFSDSTLSKNNWFYGDMELLKKWRAIAPENFFMPLQKVSRAEFTKMTLIAFGVAIANEPKPSVNPFNDVSKNDDYASYIAIAKNEGIVDGYSDGTFGPEHLITRAEAAKILINHAKAKSEIPSGVKLADYDNYRYLYSDFDEYLDGDNKSYWFVTEFLSTSRELGILEGQGQGGIQRKLALNEQISRAEAVKMISAAVCVSWLSRAVLERRDPLTGLHCVYAGRL